MDLIVLFVSYTKHNYVECDPLQFSGFINTFTDTLMQLMASARMLNDIFHERVSIKYPFWSEKADTCQFEIVLR